MFTEPYAPGLPKIAGMLCTPQTVRATRDGKYGSVEDQGLVPGIQPMQVSFVSLTELKLPGKRNLH